MSMQGLWPEVSLFKSPSLNPLIINQIIIIIFCDNQNVKHIYYYKMLESMNLSNKHEKASEQESNACV